MIYKNERIQKVLAQAGYASRRQVEQWIKDGKIKVNGVLAKLGDTITHHDQVSVAGRPLNIFKRTDPTSKILMYHKHEGYICTRKDPKGRKTIFTDLPKLDQGRWVSIGRLDINTSGLILLTNQGDIAHKLMHPSYEIEREYAVRIFGRVHPSVLDNLKAGVELEDGMARFDIIKDAGGEGVNHWYHVTLKEGKNREVRRMWESQGLTVSRLMRIRFGNVALPPDLRRRQCRELAPKLVKNLLSLIDDNSRKSKSII